MDNEWYEKGELPPVRTYCECTWGNGFSWYECVILPNEMVARNCVHQYWDLYDIDETYKFRPIQPERDKLINKGEQDIKSLNPELDREVIARLVDAGWRPSDE